MDHPPPSDDSAQRVYEVAAELFAVMATPLRLRILSALCHEEKNVGQLVNELAASQPNLSQHLSVLYRAGILTRRRQGNQAFYAIGNPKAVSLCRAVCTQIAIEIDDPGAIAPVERLAPPHAGRLAAG